MLQWLGAVIGTAAQAFVATKDLEAILSKKGVGLVAILPKNPLASHLQVSIVIRMMVFILLAGTFSEVLLLHPKRNIKQNMRRKNLNRLLSFIYYRYKNKLISYQENRLCENGTWYMSGLQHAYPQYYYFCETWLMYDIPHKYHRDSNLHRQRNEGQDHQQLSLWRRKSHPSQTRCWVYLLKLTPV
jgi:hypothetical protein